jgi:hypothetical protein
MSSRDERVEKAMAELKRVDDARLAALVDGRAANAMFEEVVGMTEPTTERRGHAGRAAGTRRPRLLWRIGIAAAVVAVLAAVLAVVDPFGSDGLTVVQQAAAALTPADGQILHVKMLGKQTNPDGSVVNWSDESWQATASPFDRRQIETSPQGTAVETATVGGAKQLYDVTRDTIYAPAAQPAASGSTTAPTPSGAPLPDMPKVSGIPAPDTITEIDTRAGQTAGTITVTIASKADGGTAMKIVQKTMDAKKAKMLVVAVAARNPDAKIGPSADTAPPATDPVQAQADADPFRAEILALLKSGKVREDGRPTIDGRQAIRFVGAQDGGRQVYIVDAATYAPIEWRTTGDGGGTVLRFVVYQTLADSSANRALLDLRAQHPDAHIDTNPADYRQAESRLFPNG